jgi:hypothetical protein
MGKSGKKRPGKLDMMSENAFANEWTKIMKEGHFLRVDAEGRQTSTIQMPSGKKHRHVLIEPRKPEDVDMSVLSNLLHSCTHVVEFVSKVCHYLFFTIPDYQEGDESYNYVIEIGGICVVGPTDDTSKKVAKRICAEALYKKILLRYPKCRDLDLIFQSFKD